MAALTTERMTRNMKICLAEVAISLATRMSSMSARVYASRCFQRRISPATAASSACGARRSMTTFTLRLLAWLACTASSSPGTPGRLNAGLAAVRARSLTRASLSLRNCTSCASLSGTKIIGSPPEDTMRRVNPTTVYSWRRMRMRSPSFSPLRMSAMAS